MQFSRANDRQYWASYYSQNADPDQASSFAQYVLPKIKTKSRIIDLGCGNGRDSVFFAQHGFLVTAVDLAVEEMNYLQDTYGAPNLVFTPGDFSKLSITRPFDVVYSRFTMHSVTEEQENATLDWISNHLTVGGLFLLEARSIKDTMLQKGVKISSTENFTDHYRRYMILENFEKKLTSRNMRILEKIESDGLAVRGNDNPVVIRIVAEKMVDK